MRVPGPAVDAAPLLGGDEARQADGGQPDRSYRYLHLDPPSRLSRPAPTIAGVAGYSKENTLNLRDRPACGHMSRRGAGGGRNGADDRVGGQGPARREDRKSTRLNSSH